MVFMLTNGINVNLMLTLGNGVHINPFHTLPQANV